MLIGYQLSLIIISNTQYPFYEPDNYEYLLFAKLSIIYSSFNVTNPNLVYYHVGFFEAPGLYQVPVLFYWFIHQISLSNSFVSNIALFWYFRVIYGLAILSIYGLSLLIARDMIKIANIQENLHYLVYTLILLNYGLLIQTQIIEWRGNTFITAFQLLIFYFLTKIALNKPKFHILLAYLALIGSLLALSWYMWSGWIINIWIVIVFCIIIICYRFLYNYMNLIIKLILTFNIIFIIFALFNPIFLINGISYIAHLLSFNGCMMNTLNLSEAQCLSLKNELGIVIFYLTISLFFLMNKNIGSDRLYLYILMLFGLILFELPLAMIYQRALQIVAPYLGLVFAFGDISLIYYLKGFDYKYNSLIDYFINLILVVSFVSFIMNLLVVYQVYNYENPIGLSNVVSFLNNYSGYRVLASYQYGGYLETYSNLKVYSDSVQELNNFPYTFNLDNCSFVSKLEPKPNFILYYNDSNIMCGSPVFIYKKWILNKFN